MKTEFSVSLMCMDFLDMKNQLEILNNKADYYHVDIMDGHYCKNITLSADFAAACNTVATIPMDIHLMTTNPTDWLKPAAEAGATYISPHAETINTDAFRVISEIESLGCKPGIVLNPATPLDSIRHYLNRLELLTIMTVDVGYAGQNFIAEMLDKIAQAKRLKEEYGYRYKIQIDGSCNKNTYKRLHDAGAEILVLGSSGLFGLDSNLDTAYHTMLQEFEEATR